MVDIYLLFSMDEVVKMVEQWGIDTGFRLLNYATLM